MANKQKGEVKFVAAGQHYVLRFSNNALCELEDATGRGALEVAADLQGAGDDNTKIRFKTVRTLFWAGLTDHHPDLTEKDAGNILQDLGLEKAFPLIGEAFQLVFGGDNAEPDGEKAPPGKQKAALTGIKCAAHGNRAGVTLSSFGV